MAQPTPLPDDEIGPLLSDPYARAWFEKHLTELREEAYGQRLLYQILAAAFVFGFVAYLAGYVLKSSTPAEPLGFLADLILLHVSALPYRTVDGGVVVVLVEVVPEVKRRQIRSALEAYEATRRDRTRT